MYGFSTENTQSGIKCDVTNCVYNNHDCGCTANQITVGPSFANSSSDTVCQSFVPKSK